MKKMAEEQHRLHNYPYVCRMIDTLQREMNTLGDLIKSEYDTHNVLQTTKEDRVRGFKDPTGDACVLIIDRYEKQAKHVSRRLEILYKDKNSIDRSMDAMTDEERKVVELRYFKKYPWWQVAQYLAYSERQCRRMDSHILEIIQGNTP